MSAGELYLLRIELFWFPQNLDVAHPPGLLSDLGASAVAEELDRGVDQKTQRKHYRDGDQLVELHGTSFGQALDASLFTTWRGPCTVFGKQQILGRPFSRETLYIRRS